MADHKTIPPYYLYRNGRIGIPKAKYGDEIAQSKQNYTD